MKKLVCFALIMALGLGLSACRSEGYGRDVTQEGAGSLAEPIEIGKTHTVTWKAGETLDVTVLEVIKGDAVWQHAENGNDETVDEGCEFALIKLSVKYVRSEASSTILLIDSDFYSYTAEGDELPGKLLDIDPEIWISPVLEVGQTVEGYISRQIKSGEGSSLLLVGKSFFKLD